MCISYKGGEKSVSSKTLAWLLMDVARMHHNQTISVLGTLGMYKLISEIQAYSPQTRPLFSPNWL